MAFTLFADTRAALARDSLHGLSVGDALGSQFFVPGRRPADLAAGRLPPTPWQWTDDTEMACSVVAELTGAGEIDRDRLALAFAHRCEPYRGYGTGAVTILRLIRTGTPWPALVPGHPTLAVAGLVQPDSGIFTLSHWQTVL
ncbi:ADP-ribosylglycohydrolase family protein, partial [Micromonospora carbonacea]|uniref:ADP-ribosylglycohydrolase family protein n=1 Tax=Micromonospora carbonacea TaxID=47853 RepID=UPI0033C2A984